MHLSGQNNISILNFDVNVVRVFFGVAVKSPLDVILNVFNLNARFDRDLVRDAAYAG